MITQDQETQLTAQLSALETYLLNGDVPAIELCIINLNLLLSKPDIVCPTDIPAFMIDSLKDPLFRRLLLAILPWIVKFIHSHQSDPGVPEIE